MSSSGSVTRSAKMKLITPPKATPWTTGRAASGMLPTEQTKEITASSGATTTFSRRVQVP